MNSRSDERAAKTGDFHGCAVQSGLSRLILRISWRVSPPRWDDRDGPDAISKSKQAESLSVPTDDRLRFDDDQDRTPVSPSCCQACPEEPVPSDQLRPLDRALENIELVPKSEHLNLKGCTAAKAIPRCY